MLETMMKLKPNQWIGNSLKRDKKEEFPFVKQVPHLVFPNGKAVYLSVVLSQLDNGTLADSHFRKFLSNLESTPFGKYAARICERLFRVVKTNLGVEQREEEVALGCAIRKLVFNFDENELFQIEELLIETRKLRKNGFSSNVEKMICKALVDRFQSAPHTYNAALQPIGKRLLLLANELGPHLSTTDATTKATFLVAVLVFLCYTNLEEVEKFSFDFIIPNSIIRLLRSLGEDIQTAVNQKIGRKDCVLASRILSNDWPIYHKRQQTGCFGIRQRGKFSLP